MFNDMLAMSAGGGGSAEWIPATYSNSNTTFYAEWDFDADCVVVFGNLGANIVAMLITNNPNGKVHAANTQSLIWNNYQDFGGTIVLNSRNITFTHSYGWSNVNVCPVIVTPSVY